MRKDYVLLVGGVFAVLATIAYLFYGSVFTGADSTLVVTQINALYFLIMIILGGVGLLVYSLKAVLEKQLNLEAVKKEEFSAQGSMDIGEKMIALEQAVASGDADLAAGIYAEAMKTYEWLASHGMSETDSAQTYARLQNLYKQILGLNKGTAN